jgi:hypothetical protein
MPLSQPYHSNGNTVSIGPPSIQAQDEIAAFTLAVCTPIYWHDRRVAFPKDVEGGSCFVLRFDGGLVGVTAAHVLDAHNTARQANSALVCQLRLMEFAFHDAVIDTNSDLDIATFRLSEFELAEIKGTAIDCRGSWPPPVPTTMQAVSLAGFPEVMRLTFPDRSCVFQAYGALTAVEDVSDREIVFSYDPAREKSLGGLDLPPLGLNMSGCSGGPVILHGTRNGLHRWFPVGIINAGSKRDGTASQIDRGDARDFDIIRARRLHFVREDGSIDVPPVGWLPGR